MATSRNKQRGLRWRQHQRRRRRHGSRRDLGRILRAAVAAVVAGLIGVAAFVAGQHNHSSAVTVLTGLAYTGGQQASVIVDGYTYGFGGIGSVTWVDSQGVTHMAVGRPA